MSTPTTARRPAILKLPAVSFQLSVPIRLLVTLVVCHLSFVAAPWALAAPVRFDIPAQPASSALQLFGRQAGVEVVYSAANLKKVQAAGVTGDMEPPAALERLLAGTGFVAKQTGASSFVVAAVVAVQPGAIEGVVRSSETGRGVEGARVTLASADKFVLTDKHGRFAFDEVPAGDQELTITAEGMQRTRVTDLTVKAGHRHTLGPITIPAQAAGVVQLEPYTVSAKKNDGVVELDPYAVEGQRPKPFSTANIDLTRTREDPLAFTTFSAKDIEYSGASNLEEFFRYRLTQNVVPTIVSERNGDTNGTSTLAGVNFRGWGTGETLILVNGRRLPTRYTSIFSSDGSAYPFDFSGLPLDSIERVEILPSAGGALYGTGSTGGIINIITRQNYTGGQLTVGFENPEKGHAPKRSADLVYGMDLGKGYSLRLTAGYSDSTPLKVGDRADVTTMRRRRAFQAYADSHAVPPGFSNMAEFLFSFIGAVGATTNIVGVDLFTPGALEITSVPPGYAGGQGLAPFLSRNGVLNIELAEGANNDTRYLSRNAAMGASSDNSTFAIGLDKRLNKDWTLSFDIEHTKGHSTSEGSYFGEGDGLFVVPASAPTNPFPPSAFVIVWFDDPRLDPPGPTFDTTSKQDRAYLTLRGQIHGWQILADAQYATNSYRSTRLIWSSSVVVGDLDAAIASGAYNPFVDMRTVAPASPEFYREAIWQKRLNESTTRLYTVTGKASGPLWTLPAGAIQTTFLGEWSRQTRGKSFQDSRLINSLTGAPVGTDSYTEPKNAPFRADNSAIAMEAVAPIVSPKAKIPLINRLEFFGSGRIAEEKVESARSDGTPFTHKAYPFLYAVGFRHDFIPGLGIRLSESIGYRPPTFSQLIPSIQSTFSTAVTDPKRNNQAVTLTPAMKLTGGNLDLKPETSVSDNIGLIFQPGFMKGFRLSFDYVRSIRDDAITSLDPQDAINLEADLPGRVVRAAPEAGAPNGVGAITFVDSTYVNFTQIKSSGFDITLEQTFEHVAGGRLVLTAAATKNQSFTIQASATTLPVQQVRNPDRNNVQEWSANGQVRWESNRWALGWNVRYFDDVLFRGNGADALVNVFVLGQNRADDAFEHDIFVSFRSKDQGRENGWRKFIQGTSVTFGVKNLLDRKPRFDATSAVFGYVGADSYVGRSFWIQLRKDL